MSDSQQNLPVSSTSQTGSRSKAYLDTTVLANALLRQDAKGQASINAIRSFIYTETPEYALKELRAGPLHGWIWCHNKFNETRSFADTFAAINIISATLQRNLGSTARQAIEQALHADKGIFLIAIEGDQGTKVDLDRVLADRYRYYLKRRITNAWRRRRTVVDNVSMPLHCFVEGDLTEDKNGNLSFERLGCAGASKCAALEALASRPHEVQKLADAVKAAPPKPENQKRHKALRHIIRTPTRPFPDSMCRNLGDAVFAIMAPPDSIIMTTNMKDFAVLATALGKSIQEP